MTNYTLKRLNIRDQLSADFLKAVSLLEKTMTAFILIFLVFFAIDIHLLTDTSIFDNVIAGTIGFLIITAKKMYYDEAWSELTIHAYINREILKNSIFAIEYSETNNGVFSSNKRLFSKFYECKTEMIIHKFEGDTHIFNGPHNKLIKLSKKLVPVVASS